MKCRRISISGRSRGRRRTRGFWSGAGLAALFCLLAFPLAGAGLEKLTWPTPNRAFYEDRPPGAFVQPTVSGEVASGLFGCVRNGGRRFHGGLDLSPLRRDRRGEAADPVFSVLPGRVVHVNRVAGHSSYGRYVVILHEAQEPAFHTLYAHLGRIPESIKRGARVGAGEVLGTMGRSAGGYTIPRSRAHLHFEIGLRLSDSFQTWFDRRDFGSKNHHGNWNGMNLVEIDPLEFFRAARSGKIESMADYLKRLPVAARVRVYTEETPAFVRDYPELLTRPVDGGEIVGWDIGFTRFGVPRTWTPRFRGEIPEGRRGDVRFLAYDRDRAENQTCKRVVGFSGSGKPELTEATLQTLRKLFGFL